MVSESIRSVRSWLAILTALVALGAGAAESNAIEFDVQSDALKFITDGTVSFPLDWDSFNAPVGANRATLVVKGDRLGEKRVTVYKPTDRIACTLFDEPPSPFRDDNITVSLAYETETNGTTKAGYCCSSLSLKCELRAGSFARERILTIDKADNLWRIYQPPIDVPFDSTWYGVPTYALVSNLVTHVFRKPAPPFTGQTLDRGFIPIDRETYGGGKLYLKMWSGDSAIAEAWLDGFRGAVVVIK